VRSPANAENAKPGMGSHLLPYKMKKEGANTRRSLTVTLKKQIKASRKTRNAERRSSAKLPKKLT